MSKLKRMSLMVLTVLFCLSAVLAADAAATKQTKQAKQKRVKEVLPIYNVQPNGMYRASVKRVVDGDTAIITFITDDGVTYQDERIRFIGVDTPETVHPKKPVQYYGKEASDFTKKSLTGRDIWVQMDVGPRDRYQRLLGYIWLEEPKDLDSEEEIRANMFNARLLLDGYGQVMTIQPNSRYADLFVTFQREAREAERGLWKPEEK